MKKLFISVVVLLFIINLAACNTIETIEKSPNSINKSQQEYKTVENSTSSALILDEYKIIKLIYSDLNNSDKLVKIEIIEEKVEEEGIVNLRGILRVIDESGSKDIIYKNNGNHLTGVFQDIQIEDIDGDGIKDIFIVIPDVGTGWPLNYFFIYNYKTGKQYSFDFDYNMNNINIFLSSFMYKYKSDNELELRNDKIGFSEVLKLNKFISMPIPNDALYRYVTPDFNPVAIVNEDYTKNKKGDKFVSSIGLVKDNKGNVEIRVPYLLEAIHHDDIIGEIDMYFIIDSNFQPVLKGFEVYNVDLEETYKKEIVKEFSIED